MSTIVRLLPLIAFSMSALLAAAPADAQSAGQPTAAELARQIQEMKREYESRIQALEGQLSKLEEERQAEKKTPATPPSKKAKADNAFNPAIGIVLNGMLASYSSKDSELPGFQLGHEGERAPEGFSLGHSEITATSNVDDKFFGALTLGMHSHPDEADEIEVEEAYIQTLPGAGLPDGVRIKAGRSLWTLGYLNEQHAHEDDFADRPLPYRAFLDNAYNDDGVEASVVLPTQSYTEIGAGAFRGSDTPFGGSEDGIDAWSGFIRVGDDLGRTGAWRVGGYILSGKSRNRGVVHDHEEDEHAHEEGEDEDHDHAEFFSEGMFTGDTQIYAIDVRATIAPTGNARESELILQGEYFWRKEDGTYTLPGEEELSVNPTEQNDEGQNLVERHVLPGETERFDTTSSGWYLQAVYKFHPQWRIGARYSQLNPPDEAELKHDPNSISAMVDWTNSEFGRLRFQYNRETLAKDQRDNQFLLQYTMSLGAHAAHSF